MGLYASQCPELAMALTTAQFWQAFLMAVSTYYPEQLDPGNRPQNALRESYDFVIVGGGTAGSVLANRLTEEAKWTVLLVEAGGPQNSVSDAPLLATASFDTDRDWNYTTVRQKKACLAHDGICKYTQGHVLGGGSTINGMMYVRGNKADYDGWAQAGCTGWDYESILPYFIKSENNTEPSLAKSRYHGTSGLQNVQYPRFVTPMREEYIKAGLEFGWQKADYNGERQSDVIDYLQFNMRGPSRCSASKAFLLPASNRKNLHIIQRSRVSKILIKKTKAVGIEYYRNGQKHTVFAKKEVIVSAGAIGTPKLLMLSGIGPKEELKKLNIPVHADLPVGVGLQDHVMIGARFRINKAYTISTDVWKTNESIYEYAEVRKGPLSTNGAEATAFFNPLNTTDIPSFQIMWFSFLGLEYKDLENLLMIVCAVVHPLSRGSVRLKSGDFRDPPLIDPNCYDDDTDLQTMQKGLERLFDYMETPTMAKYQPEFMPVGLEKCADKKERSELITCLILQHTQTIYHPVATARMGPPGDKRAVVSPNLLVHGFKNLRVIDASVMPMVPRGNTNAPTTMVAEKGADIIKATYRKTPGSHTLECFGKING